MALADTANLIVSLKLDDKFSGPMRGINNQIDTLSKNASIKGGVSQIGQGIGLGLKRGAIIGGVALAGIATQVKAGVDSLRELENVTKQTEAVIKSTGGVAGITAKEIRDMSEEYETLGGVLDDKVIQSGANVLLTFKDIKKEAFQPALEAALDLSTALDQDLQSSVIQIGKALNDPVRGLTALRRVGVSFTKEQEDQIKDLVAAGKDLEAQQIILTELNTEFGGSFEAAGQTGEATIARFQDSIEGLQQNLATAFLPAIDKIARRLTDIFADPETQQQVKDFGETLAGFLSDENLDRAEEAIRGTFGYLAGLPWDAIGTGLSVAADAAKKAVDIFRSLPPDVQNALITLLAANKLTGGLVASGLGQLASVALGSLKSIVAGNVTVIGKTVTTPGVPGGGTAGGGGGVLGRLAGGAALAGGVVAAGVATAMTVEFGVKTSAQAESLKASLDKLPRNTAAELDTSLGKIDDAIEAANSSLGATLISNFTGVNHNLERERDELIQTKKNTERAAAAARDAIPWAIRNKQEIVNLNMSEGRRFAHLGQLTERQKQAIHTLNASEGTRAANLANLARTANGYGARTARASEITSTKKFDPKITTNNNITIPVTVGINASVIQQQIYRLRTTTNSGGFI